MHIDSEGIPHPLTLTPEMESHDVYYASCKTCGSRWAGPFGSLASAVEVAQLANANAYYDLPARVRSSTLGLCHGPDGLPIGTPGAMTDAVPPQRVQLAQAVHDVGKMVLIVGYIVFTTVRTIVLFAIGVVRFVNKIGKLGAVVVGALMLAVFLGLNAAAPHIPDTATVATASVGVLGVLVALGVVTVLVRGVRDKVAEYARTQKDCSTPLTTAEGMSSISPVSKTPADESPRGNGGSCK
jgi:hypothetical protein